MSGAPTVAFLDRDGTIIDDVHYIARPEQVRLIPGAAAAIARLNAAKIPVIVVTNQSGIARGLLTVADYGAVQLRMLEALADEGARVDASYMCPHLPSITGPCDCRKPGVLLFERAAQDLGLDLTRPVFAGDRWRDVAPAERLGGRRFLIRSPRTPEDEIERGRSADVLYASLADAVDAMMSRLSDMAPHD